MAEGVEKTNVNKKEKNKALAIVSNILFTIFMIVILFFIFITAQSRLTGVEPSILGHRLYIVESGSMLPALRINSMIIAKELPASEIEVGDILSFYGKNADVRITHRVVEIQNDGEAFITRGDANNTNDPNPVTKDRVIGKIVFSIPLIGLIFKALSNPIAIAIIVLIGIAWILIPKLIKKEE